MSREIAEYLLECVKDANPTSPGKYDSHVNTLIKHTSLWFH